jgi:hypothetical protein
MYERVSSVEAKVAGGAEERAAEESYDVQDWRARKFMKKNTVKKDNFKKGEVVIYKPPKNEVELMVHLEDETVWLDAHQMAQVFNIDRTVVVKHIRNVYKSNELSENSTCAKIAQVAAE